MLKNLTAIIAGTLIALATGPAFAQGQNVGEEIMNLGESLDSILNLLEPKTIFVTSSVLNGDLDGLPGADQMCQDHADGDFGVSIVPSGVYVALLSTDSVNAAERITATSGPYIRPDGVYVSANAAGLFETVNGILLITPVSVDESGGPAPGGVLTWTGSIANGSSFGLNCLNWESDSGGEFGEIGSRTATDDTWLDLADIDCQTDLHLYCVRL